MKRSKKVDVIASAIKRNLFGVPLTDEEYRWVAEHVVDALKEAKNAR